MDMASDRSPETREAPTRRTFRAAPDAPLERPVLLLVDDVPDNLMALEGLLRRDDLTIVKAGSAKEGLEVLLERDVSLAIIDVRMPEIDGIELARLMRGSERTRRVPIIFLTGSGRRPERALEGYDAGAIDYLIKPVDGRILAGKVDALLSLDAQRRALRRGEQRFRSLVEATAQVVWCAAPDGRVVVDSPTWRAFTGQTWEEFQGDGWLQAVHPDDRTRARAAWETAVASWSASACEYRLRRADGGHVWTAARSAPVLDERGKLVEWVVAHTSIAEQKEAEVLREMFMGMLGHDLRSPIGSMMMAARLGQRWTQDERLQTQLRRIIASGERALGMIEQLLDTSRIRLGGGITLSPRQGDLAQVASDALAELPEANERARVETDGDATGTWDLDRLFQVLSNLAGNALQHSTPGSPVELRIDGTQPDLVELAVKSTGPAIAAEQVERLFVPFGSRQKPGRGQRGLGLGLYITRHLVQAHGGEVRVESSEADGLTTFRVRLPRHASGAVAAAS